MQRFRDECDASRLAAAFWSSCKRDDSRTPVQSQQSGSKKRMSAILNVCFRSKRPMSDRSERDETTAAFTCLSNKTVKGVQGQFYPQTFLLLLGGGGSEKNNLSFTLV